jgi:hypothetical protein
MTSTLLDLGRQPLVNNLLDSAEEALSAERWPLRAVCHSDLTIHLDTEIPPNKLYQNYLYRSGVSEPYVRHCEQMHASLSHLKQEVVMDIGGNDGTLLKTFKRQNKGRGVYINVDASASFLADNECDGIQYVNALFNRRLDLPKADIITSTNVFQHTKDARSFVEGVVEFLNGVWVLEFPYTLNTLLTLQFDQFYHEHYYYWLITPLHKLFAEYGLRIIHAQELDIHGGTMRLWITNKDPGASEITSVINRYQLKESLVDLNAFNSFCLDAMERSHNFIDALKGRTVFFGAAAKGCVFLDALGLTIESQPSSFVVDDTPCKQGKFVPGAGFEIRPRRALADEHVDNVIVLAHNFGHYIAGSLRNDGFQGKIYTCLPTVTEF